MQKRIRSTTILCVRRDGKVVMAGDGQSDGSGSGSAQGVGKEVAAPL